MTDQHPDDCEPIRHPDDCERIVSVAKQHRVPLSLNEAQRIWDEYSERVDAAGWTCLPIDNEELWNSVQYGMDLLER